MSRDPRVDAYIAGRNAFAQPILTHIRELIHAHAPQVEETIKWGMSSFARPSNGWARASAAAGSAGSARENPAVPGIAGLALPGQVKRRREPYGTASVRRTGYSP